MRELTAEELALVAGGSNTYGASWFETLWDFICDLFSFGYAGPDIAFQEGIDTQINGAGFVDTWNDPNPADDPPTTAEIHIEVKGAVEPVDVHTSIEVFGLSIPFLNIHVQGVPYN